MLDLFDLDVSPVPMAKLSHHWLCTKCRAVSLRTGKCASCSGTDFIPFLDRRPLRLDRETLNGIVELIDQAADSLAQMDVDKAIIVSGEYMPFLSQLLKGHELAQVREATTGSGFRVTSLPSSTLLELFRKSQVPPSES